MNVMDGINYNDMSETKEYELEKYIKNDPPDCKCTGCVIRNVRNIVETTIPLDIDSIFQQISQHQEYEKSRAIKDNIWHTPDKGSITLIFDKILDNILNYTKEDILQLIEIIELKVILRERNIGDPKRYLKRKQKLVKEMNEKLSL